MMSKLPYTRASGCERVRVPAAEGDLGCVCRAAPTAVAAKVVEAVSSRLCLELDRFRRLLPEDVDRAQHRIASTSQHLISTDTK